MKLKKLKVPSKRSSESPKKRQKTIRKSEIVQIGDAKKEIIGFLTFKTNSRLMTSFRQAFTIWQEVLCLRRKNEKAEIVLAAYLRQNKIQDYLKKLSTFISRKELMEDASKIRFMAYNNYFYFLQLFICDMKKEISCIDDEDIPLDANEDTVAWFIYDECLSVSSIRDIPKAYEAVKRLNKSMIVGNPMNSQQAADITTVFGCIDMLSLEVTEDDMDEMDRIYNSLRERLALMKKNADNADILYDAMITCFPDEWFVKINPDSDMSIVNDLSKEELLDLYKRKMDDFFSKINGLNF